MISSSSDSPVEHLDYKTRKKLTDTEELHRMFNYKPPRLIPHSESSLSPLLSPLSFYDKHIDKSLTLKHVRVSSDLLLEVPDTVTAAFDSMKQQGIRPFFNGFARVVIRQADRVRFEPICDAEFLADLLGKTTVEYCRSAACTMFVSPRNSVWASLLMWTKSNRGKEARASGTVKYCLEINWTTLNRLDEDLKESISQVMQRCPEIAIWMINTVSDEAKALLMQMDDFASSKSFGWRICLTKGYTTEPFASKDIFDGRKAPWKIPVRFTRSIPSISDGPWRNTRTRNMGSSPRHGSVRTDRTVRPTTEDRRKVKVHVVYLPSEARVKKCREEAASSATPEQLLQHVSLFLWCISYISIISWITSRPGLKLFVKTPP